MFTVFVDHGAFYEAMAIAIHKIFALLAVAAAEPHTVPDIHTFRALFPGRPTDCECFPPLVRSVYEQMEDMANGKMFI